MKLLYAFPEPLPLPRARGIQVAHTVKALAEQGVEVTLAHVPAEGDPFGACGLERPANVTLAPVSRSLPAPLGRWHSNRMFARRLAQVVAAQAPDAVFVRHLKIAVLLRERFPALPILYEAHEVFADTADPAKRARVAALERCALDAATALVANSAATAARLRERYGVTRPIEVVPNGVERPASPPRKDWTGAASRIVYAGTLFPWKGVADLVSAAAALAGCTITIAGGEPAEVEALRAKVGADGARVVFSGRIPQAAVRALLEESCIAVLPNRADADSAFTSPIKLFEYMAAGCAVVAADLPAVREILGEAEAAWFTPGDPATLSKAIRALADDPGRAQRLGERLHAKSAAFTWSKRGERLAGVLRGIVAGAGG